MTSKLDERPHEILGISATATPDEARAAYRRLAQLHHPDKGGSIETFQAIKAAYETFQRRQPCPECEGKGFIIVRQGLAVNRSACPTCWKKP